MITPVRRLMGSLIAIAVCSLLLCETSFAQTKQIPFDVKLDVIHQELSPKFCWFHPRVAAIPGQGKDAAPALVVTLQKHLGVSDHYSGVSFMRSDDLGKTWTPPVLPPELDWRSGPNDTDIAVADVTPGWHAPSGKLIAVGIKLIYSKTGEQLVSEPRSHQCTYAVYDPKSNRWTEWKNLETPDTDGKFHLVAPGCVQWHVNDDGSLLIPMYFNHPPHPYYTSTVMRCRFDGETMIYETHGDEISIPVERGICEPSLVKYAGRFYLTLRNDLKGYVTVSDDGLHFAPIKPWTFDDGSDLGSYNTQQHWLAHSDGLFLAYTRRGADNDHIPRNRAPIFLAQVDPEKLHVIRATEKPVIPERGAMLGNFGAAPINEHESWITDGEYYMGDQPHPRGADGSLFAARIIWSKPNRLAPKP